MSSGPKKEVRIFTNSNLDIMVREINAYLKDKSDAEITYHNVPHPNFTYVIATVKATHSPQAD